MTTLTLNRPKLNVSTQSQSDFILGAMLIAAVIAFLCQVAIEFSQDNLIAAGLATASSLITIYYLKSTRSFLVLPLSSFSILGLCMTTQFGALVAQSAAWTSVAGNLNLPRETFGWLFLYQMIAVIAQIVFRSLQPAMTARQFIALNIVRPLGLFDIPSPAALWLIGIVGFVSFAARGGETGDAVSKFFVAFNFLAWSPFLIPLLHTEYGKSYCRIGRHGIGLVFYTFAALVLGVAMNVRVIMFVGVVTASLMFLLFRLSEDRPFQQKSVKFVVLGFAVAIFAGSFASNFVTAMAIARQIRAEASPAAMIRETLYNVFDSNRIEVYKQSEELRGQIGIFGEYYLANPIIARFVETKFHDNAFWWTEDLIPDQIRDIQEVTIDRALAVMPDPLLKALGLNVDKSVTEFSMGDYFIYLKTGRPLGGFVTGSMFAHGNVIAGPAFPLIYFGLCLLLFLMWESFVLMQPGARRQISIIPMLVAWPLFIYGITAESLNHMFMGIVRTLPQNIFIYLTLYYLTSIFFKPYLKPRANRAG